ncbi:MAG: tetratricopeptide repeat protein [Chitinophagaceae bacterium]
MNRHFFMIFFLFLVYSMPLSAQDFDDLNNLAFKERDNKNYQKAIELCTQALNKKVNARSYIIRADCRYELKDYEAAITDFNSALTYYSSYYTDNKEKAGIYYMIGRSKHDLYKYSDAITDYTTALTYNYEEPGYIYWNRGTCYYELGKYKDAKDDFTKAIDRISASEDLSTIYSDKGDCEAKLGNYEAAYTLYTRAISYNSNNYNAFWQRGHYKSQEKKYTEALSDFDKAIELITKNPEPSANNDLAILYRNKAIMHRDLRQYDEGLAAINKSVATDPNMAKTYRIRAEIYQAMKKYDRAKIEYGNSITLQTDKKIKSDILLDRSIMERQLLDYKSCLDDLNKAVELDPTDGLNYWHRSVLYGYKKNYPAAIKDCNLAIDRYKSDSSSTASLYWLRSGFKDITGDFTGATEDYQVYLKYYPQSYSGYYELGRLFKLKLKNIDLANANLDKALELAEKAYDTSKISYIYLIKGEKELAYKKMLEHIDNNKNDAYQYKWGLHNMACIYAMAGNTNKAFEFQDKSFKAGFDDYLHLVNDRDLATIMKLPQWKTMLTKYKVPVPQN